MAESCKLFSDLPMHGRHTSTHMHARQMHKQTSKNVKILIKQNQELVQVLMVIVSYGSITGSFFLYFSLLSLFLNIFVIYCVRARTHLWVPTWRSEELFLSFHHVGYGDLTEVVRLRSQHPYLLSLISPACLPVCLFCFETGGQNVLELTVWLRTTQNFWTASLPVLGLQACMNAPGLWCDGNWTQGNVHFRQAPHPVTDWTTSLITFFLFS